MFARGRTRQRDLCGWPNAKRCGLSMYIPHFRNYWLAASLSHRLILLHTHPHSLVFVNAHAWIRIHRRVWKCKLATIRPRNDKTRRQEQWQGCPEITPWRYFQSLFNSPRLKTPRSGAKKKPTKSWMPQTIKKIKCGNMKKMIKVAQFGMRVEKQIAT